MAKRPPKIKDAAQEESQPVPRPNLSLAKRLTAQNLDRESVIELARMVSYSNEKMANWVKAYDAHEFASNMTYESICEHNENVPNSLEFYALIVTLNVEIHQTDSIAMAKTAMPRIIQKSIEFAGELDGFRDRELMMKVSQIPGVQPQSIQINNQINASQNNFLAAGVPRFNSDADDDSTREILEATLPAQLPVAREEFIDAVVIENREKQDA